MSTSLLKENKNHRIFSWSKYPKEYMDFQIAFELEIYMKLYLDSWNLRSENILHT